MRPRRVDLTVSFLAWAPRVFSSHSRAFLRAGMTAQALRAAKRASAGAIRNGGVQTARTARQRAEVRHHPLGPGKFQPACHQPVVCRNGSPTSAFSVRHAWIAASEKVADRPRLPDGAPNHCVSGANQISNEPRCLGAALQERQLQHRDQGGGRRRVVRQETRAFQASAMAQGSLGN